MEADFPLDEKTKENLLALHIKQLNEVLNLMFLQKDVISVESSNTSLTENLMRAS